MWRNYPLSYDRFRLLEAEEHDFQDEEKAPNILNIKTLPDSQSTDGTRDKMEIPLRDRSILCEIGFDVGNMIGSGAYAYVYNGACNELALKTYRIDKNNWWSESLKGREFAVKFFELTGHAEYAEAKFMSELQHPNIVEVLFVANIQYKRIYVFMELADMGSLQNFITEKTGFDVKRFSEMQTQKFIKQLTSGLTHLHDRRIVHGDIHWGNILLFSGLDPTGDLVAKLSDFGLSREYGNIRNDLVKLGLVFMDISEYTQYHTFEFEEEVQDMRDRLMSGQFVRINQLSRTFLIVYGSVQF